MNKTLTIIIVALVILAAVVYFMTGKDDVALDVVSDETVEVSEDQDDQVSVDAGTGAGANTNNTVQTNSVVLAAAETGMKATISRAVLSVPGYVVVYRVNSQNKTEVIGSTDLLSAGAYSNLSVSLDSGIAKDQTIVAVLHADDGDGEFEFPGSDGYLSDANQSVYSDVDVVDMSAEDESEALDENVKEFLMENEA